MLLLCLIALEAERKPDAGVYIVNITLAPYFLHSGCVNAAVPVSMMSLNTSQASAAPGGPFWQQLHPSHHTICPRTPHKDMGKERK